MSRFSFANFPIEQSLASHPPQEVIPNLNPSRLPFRASNLLPKSALAYGTCRKAKLKAVCSDSRRASSLCNKSTTLTKRERRQTEYLVPNHPASQSTQYIWGSKVQLLTCLHRLATRQTNRTEANDRAAQGNAPRGNATQRKHRLQSAALSTLD